MVTKAISNKDYENLKQHLGKEWADWVTNAAEAQGKALENAGVAFKMPFPPNEEDEEDEEDGMDKPPKKEDETISKTDLILFSGLKESAQLVLAAQEEISELRKAVKDLSNQIDQLRNGQGDQVDGVRRMNTYFETLMKRAPASKSDQTLYEGGNPAIDKAVQKNHDQETVPKPVLTQMKANAGVSIPQFNQSDAD